MIRWVAWGMALIPALASAQTLKSAAELRIALFKPEFVAPGLRFANPITHLLCDADNVNAGMCTSTVTVGMQKAHPGNSCGVRATDVIVANPAVKGLRWNLVVDDSNGVEYRFWQLAGGNGAPTDWGIVIEENTWDLANEDRVIAAEHAPEQSVPFHTPVQRPLVYELQIAGQNNPAYKKSHKFAIRVQFQVKNGEWVDCDPLDPIIMNDGG